jgi:hypothetical protein
MAGITTAFLNSAKTDILSALHCFNATVAKTASGVNGAFTLTGLADVTGLAVGMAASGSNVAAGAVIASIDSGTQVTLSKAHTNTITTASITFTADVFKLALIIPSMAGTYSKSTTNYTDVTGNSDEVANGSGYTTGGVALTNVSPALSTDTAVLDFSDVSWTSASFSARGCIIYNTTRRGPVATRALSVHDFGGTQTVASGTFSLVFPTPDASNAILRIA